MSTSIKIYIINLKRADDRKLFMKDQLKRIGLDFEFIEAIDAKTISDKDLDDTNNIKSWSENLTKGEFACALSHVKAYKILANENNYDHGLIVEDDIIISRKIKSILNQIEEKKGNSELILLYSSIHRPVKLKLIHSLELGYGIVSADNIKGVHGTPAYFISKELASSLSEAVMPIQTVADDWKLFLEKRFFSDIKLVYPFPILHAEFLSLVNQKKSNTSLRTKLKNFIYRNRIFPFYDGFLWYRRYCAEKIQRKYIYAPEFLNRKTYKL